LLRVLQERVIERLGGSGEVRVDVRIVAATHQDMMALVRNGRFRLDLFYRLNVIPIRLPALRERMGDIKLLVRHFISQLNQHYQRNTLITPQAMRSLVSYPWPGNIRQLYNVCERLVLLSRSDEIDESTVDYVLVTEAQGQPVEVLAQTAAVPSILSESPSLIRSYQSVSESERDRIAAALAAHGGNKSRTAKALNLTLRQLNYRIQVLAIPQPEKNKL
jgi:Nif-specific regulatory protein